MMTNLFSVFDPSSSFLSMAWMLLIFFPLMVSLPQWKFSHPMLLIKQKTVNTLFKEVSFTLKSKSKGQEISILMIFLSILIMNFTALYPQVFSLTSHLTITLPLSLTAWLSVVLFGWMKNTNHMLAHLVPQGTPNALMSFMVLIELTSNLIRPITLCVRLTANLIAGHLLMTLLGNSLMAIPATLSLLSVACPLILTVLESAVACIQAYVFMTLITLYVTEVKYDKKI